MKISRILIPVILLLGLGYLVYAQLSENKAIIDQRTAPRKEVVLNMPVTVHRADVSTYRDSLVINGTFEAKKELDVIAESAGRITQLPVREGQRIGRGAVIARIDDSSIRAQLDMINAQLEKSKNDVASFERLLKAGAVSEQQYEEVKLGQKNIEANLAAVTQQLEYTTLINPMAGVIKTVPVEEGSFVSPGTVVATIVDITSLKMVIQVPEKEVVKLKTGQKVSIITDVYPDKIFRGTITLIAVQADAARKFNVEIELPVSSAYPLKPGMFGTVKVNTSDKPVESVLIPRKAVVGSIQNPEVYVVEDGKAVIRSIEIGRTIADQVEVKQGVIAGDVVILSGHINLENGSPVQVISGGTANTFNESTSISE